MLRDEQQSDGALVDAETAAKRPWAVAGRAHVDFFSGAGRNRLGCHSGGDGSDKIVQQEQVLRKLAGKTPFASFEE